ncbi:MAG: prepilin-type N-terminal cleavage/methylation domain-containing protein [Candidatus Omnitrophica bacterium]|nr:prepilin-type N-terminal cleavage/methylation domain-containing protein [Candidatus Omnitrophota bacterium]
MKKSFTLIELIVVIAIIAILAAIIAPNAFKAIEKAKVARVIADSRVLKTSVGALYADTGRKVMDGYTGTQMHLLPGQNPLDTNPLNITLHWAPATWPGWDGPYVEKTPGMHPWGGQYAFTCWQDYSDPVNGIEELVLEIDNYCYPYVEGVINPSTCRMPQSAAKKLDTMVDDDEDWPLNTGNVRGSAGGSMSDIHWILFWDYDDRYTP